MLIFLITNPILSESISTQPLTIIVIDPKTKKPLSNIIVYYMLETYRYKKTYFWLIPVFDNGEVRRKVILKQYFTDSNGVISIKRGDFNIRNDEMLEEHIVVNLDHKDKIKKNHIEIFFQDIAGYCVYKTNFYNKNAKYRSAYIVYSEMRHENSMSDYKDSLKDKIDLDWFKVNLREKLVNDEEIVVKLKHYEK